MIQRNILKTRAGTRSTPYQAEISQGRLEALLNFQTVVDLTGLPVANASLLDEATAAAEAMAMAYGVRGGEERNTFWVSELCHPQTIDVVRTRAAARGIDVVVGDHTSFDWSAPVFGILLQYPATDGAVLDYRPFVERAHSEGAVVTVAADLLSLTLLAPPGKWGADIVVGSTQRFGVPSASAGRTPPTSPARMRTSAPSRGVSSACRRMRTANRRSAWRCKRASSTSGAKRLPPTSAPRRCCWR